MQIAPLHKHSIEAQKINFAKHNEAHKNLPRAYKKACSLQQKINFICNTKVRFILADSKISNAYYF